MNSDNYVLYFPGKLEAGWISRQQASMYKKIEQSIYTPENLDVVCLNLTKLAHYSPFLL